MSYGIGETPVVNGVDFRQKLLESLPPTYRETPDLLNRLLLPSAEYLAWSYDTWRTLFEKLTPRTAPSDWLDWLLTEVMGWTLIPPGYPEEIASDEPPPLDFTPPLRIGKRRLLQNLHAHYKRRGTVWRSANSYENLSLQLSDPASAAGIEMLLLEFGVHAQVTDSPLYPDSDYYGGYGSEWPLQARVVVLWLEPWEVGTESFADDYWGGAYAHETPLIVTREFVRDLVEWSRTGSTLIHIEFETTSSPPDETPLMV